MNMENVTFCQVTSLAVALAVSIRLRNSEHVLIGAFTNTPSNPTK